MENIYEHNKRITGILNGFEMDQPKLNRIKCPDCGTELWDSQPNEGLPEKIRVHCIECGFHHYRILRK